jgi:hypothetical protein
MTLIQEQSVAVSAWMWTRKTLSMTDYLVIPENIKPLCSIFYFLFISLNSGGGHGNEDNNENNNTLLTAVFTGAITSYYTYALLIYLLHGAESVLRS